MAHYFADLSNNQGRLVDPATIAVEGTYLKASEGAGYTDPYRAGWQAELEQRGIPVGTYHFHRGSASPRAQLARWIDSGLDAGVWRPVLDCEDEKRTLGPVDLTRNCLDLAALVAEHTGVQPIIYTGAWWLTGYATPDPAWAAYDLWLAGYPLGYNRTPSDDEAEAWLAEGIWSAAPAPWSGNPLAWQFTSIAQTVGGNTDRSIVTDANWPRLWRDPNATTQEEDMPTAEEVANAVIAKMAEPYTVGAVNQAANDIVATLGAGIHAVADKVGATVDANAVAKAVLAGLSPKAIADLIDDNIAKAVADEITKRLAN